MMLAIRYGVVTMFAAALVLFSMTPSSAQEEKSYSIGVIPAFPPVETHRVWTPFVKRLSQETGIAFRLKVYEKMNDFEQNIISNETPDFIFTNALQIVVAHHDQGYIPLVRGATKIHSVLFVRKASPIRTIDDLADKRIAFVGSKNL
jgi:phosphonate transport system substrate-binding protein